VEQSGTNGTKKGDFEGIIVSLSGDGDALKWLWAIGDGLYPSPAYHAPFRAEKQAFPKP